MAKLTTFSYCNLTSKHVQINCFQYQKKKKNKKSATNTIRSSPKGTTSISSRLRLGIHRSSNLVLCNHFTSLSSNKSRNFKKKKYSFQQDKMLQSSSQFFNQKNEGIHVFLYRRDIELESQSLSHLFGWHKSCKFCPTQSQSNTGQTQYVSRTKKKDATTNLGLVFLCGTKVSFFYLIDISIKTKHKHSTT